MLGKQAPPRHAAPRSTKKVHGRFFYWQILLLGAISILLFLTLFTLLSRGHNSSELVDERAATLPSELRSYIPTPSQTSYLGWSLSSHSSSSPQQVLTDNEGTTFGKGLEPGSRLLVIQHLVPNQVGIADGETLGAEVRGPLFNYASALPADYASALPAPTVPTMVEVVTMPDVTGAPHEQLEVIPTSPLQAEEHAANSDSAGNADGGSPTADQWAALRHCESGGSYTILSPSGQYRGAYQFSIATWDWVASQFRRDLVGVDPATATETDQDAMALALYDLNGATPWPTCGRYLS